MLGYYGTILCVIITVATFVATKTFTKQIQRESFFKYESEEWSELLGKFFYE